MTATANEHGVFVRNVEEIPIYGASDRARLHVVVDLACDENGAWRFGYNVMARAYGFSAPCSLRGRPFTTRGDAFNAALELLERRFRDSIRGWGQDEDTHAFLLAVLGAKAPQLDLFEVGA